MATQNINIRVTQKGARKVKRELAGLSKGTRRVSSSLMANTVAAAATAVALKTLGGAAMGAADGYTNLVNQSRVFASSEAQAADRMGATIGIARSLHATLNEVGTVYQRLAMIQTSTNFNDTQMETMVRNLTAAVKISGATAQEAEGAMRQFAQGMAANRLSGQELNAVLEQTPLVAKILAESLGVGTGELRAMGTAGMLTTDVLVNAFGGSIESLDKQLANFNFTFEALFGSLRRELNLTAGEFISNSGAGKSMSDSLKELIQSTIDATKFLAEHKNEIILYAEIAGVAIGILGGLAGAFILAKGAMFGFSLFTGAGTFLLGLFTGAAGLATTAIGGLSTAMGIMAFFGAPVWIPIAAAIAAIAAAAVLAYGAFQGLKAGWAAYTKEAREADALAQIEKETREAAEAADLLSGKFTRLRLATIAVNEALWDESDYSTLIPDLPDADNAQQVLEGMAIAMRDAAKARTELAAANLKADREGEKGTAAKKYLASVSEEIKARQELEEHREGARLAIELGWATLEQTAQWEREYSAAVLETAKALADKNAEEARQKGSLSKDGIEQLEDFAASATEASAASHALQQHVFRVADAVQYAGLSVTDAGISIDEFIEKQQKAADNGLAEKYQTFSDSILPPMAAALLENAKAQDLLNASQAAGNVITDAQIAQMEYMAELREREAEQKEIDQQFEIASRDGVLTDIENMDRVKVGAVEALDGIKAQATNVSGIVAGGLGGAFNLVETSILELATTGKANFKAFARSFLQLIQQMIIKLLIAVALQKALSMYTGGATTVSELPTGGGGFTGLSTGGATTQYVTPPGLAGGGPISGPTIVGERGPELFVPPTSGSIKNNTTTMGMLNPKPPVVTIVNVDSQENVLNALGTQEAEAAILNVIQTNPDAIRGLA